MVPVGDSLNVNHLLSDEERAIRDSVRAFVSGRILPNVGGLHARFSAPTASLSNTP